MAAGVLSAGVFTILDLAVNIGSLLANKPSSGISISNTGICQIGAKFRVSIGVSHLEARAD